MLPFEEVVAALGRRSERDLGVQSIPLDSIVGTVDRRPDEFDREFRPASERAARPLGADRRRAPPRRGDAADRRLPDRRAALRAGRPPPRVGRARARRHRHRRARARGRARSSAPTATLRLRDLPLKRHERVFFERVPLPPAARPRIQLSDEWRYAQLGTLIEAWGFRASHARGHLLTPRGDRRGVVRRGVRAGRRGAARRPTFGGPGTETERYLRIAMLRYLLLQTHDWTDEIVEQLLGEVRAAGAGGRHDGAPDPQGDELSALSRRAGRAG